MLLFSVQDVGLWLEEINLGNYRQVFKENGVNGEYLEGMSMFTTEQILRFIRRCHMKWGDFITLCKELRRIKGIPHSLYDVYLGNRLFTCDWLISFIPVHNDLIYYLYWYLFVNIVICSCEIDFQTFRVLYAQVTFMCFPFGFKFKLDVYMYAEMSYISSGLFKGGAKGSQAMVGSLLPLRGLC